MIEKVGIVTITYNSSFVIEEFLNSILSQTFKNFILFIIDNASSDATIKRIQKYDDPRIRVIKNNNNLGVAAGNNQGITMAIENACDGILLMNNDTCFEKDLITKHLKVINNNDCSVVVPKMMYYPEKDIIWYGGGFLNKNKAYWSSVRGINSKDNGNFDKTEFVSFAPSCCVLIKKQVFEDIGLMDEKYFVYLDETDFWYRMAIDGRHKMMYFGNVEFYHKVGSLTKSSKKIGNKSKLGNFYIKFTTRNQVYFLRKQKTLLSFLMLLYFYLRLNLKFFITGKYNRNFTTFYLIQKSFVQGFYL